MSERTHATTLVFYDGVCGLCDRLVHFLLTHDRQGVLRFAQLQGELARRVLMPSGHDPRDLDSVFVVDGWNTPDARLLSRSRAVLHAVRQLGGVWTALGAIASIVPVPVADAVYSVVARYRYRVFGRFDTCPMPRPEWRSRFVEDQPRAGGAG